MAHRKSVLLKQIRSAFSTMHARASTWAVQREAEILQAGSPLNADEQDLASQVGIMHPEQVRILHVANIPSPDTELLQAAAFEVGLLGSNAASLTLGHGIYLTASATHDDLLHQLCHVRQYERLGGIRNFLALFMAQVITHGHDNAPLEVESRMLALAASTPG